MALRTGTPGRGKTAGWEVWLAEKCEAIAQVGDDLAAGRIDRTEAVDRLEDLGIRGRAADQTVTSWLT
jgi:hypothetical protein